MRELLERVQESIGTWENESKEYLPETNKKPINRELYDLTKGYHDSLLIDEIGAVLKKHGLILLQEDGTEFSGIFSGEEGRAEIEVARNVSTADADGHPIYQPLENTMLILTWHKMESGKFEVIAYLS